MTTKTKKTSPFVRSDEDRAVHEDPLSQMRERGGDWYAYQNHDMGHPELGHLAFMKCGPGCTFEEPPGKHPDTPGKIMWRYVLVGRVDLDEGKVVDL